MNLPVVDTTHPKSNKFLMGVEIKAADVLKLNDSPDQAKILGCKKQEGKNRGPLRCLTNGEFPLCDMPAGNHGSCIHQDKNPVQGDEQNYHDYLQACLIGGIGH